MFKINEIKVWPYSSVKEFKGFEMRIVIIKLAEAINNLQDQVDGLEAQLQNKTDKIHDHFMI